MLNKTLTSLAGAALLMGSSVVAADNGWYAEAQYQSLDISVDGLSVALGAMGIVLGRDLTENIAVELVAGLGAGDDSVDGIKVEVDRYVGLVVKPNMDINEQVNIFLALGYVDIQLEASAGGESLKDSSSEFMWGVGGEVSFNENMYGTIGYSDIDGADGVQLSIGLRF